MDLGMRGGVPQAEGVPSQSLVDVNATTRIHDSLTFLGAT